MRIFAVLFALILAPCSVLAEQRVALLIGNNNYPTAPLRNAVNDARDLAEVLKELGFKTILRENASRQEMIGAIQEFSKQLEGAETALFFYAGHAMQFKERNFLIPVDADMKSEDDVTFSSVEVSQVFDRMERAKTRFNFILLDACRDNPFASSFKVSSSGLAQIANAPSGTLVAYATAPGSVAADGFGRNGVYTKHILQQIKAPEVPAEIMFKRVREAVERETRRLQTPWDVSSLKGDFVFNTAGGAKPSAASAAGPSSDAQLAIEREFWVSVRDSTRAEDIQAYLDKYPKGQYTILARNRLESLLRPASTQVARADPPPQQAAPAASSPAAATGQPSRPAQGSGNTAAAPATTQTVPALPTSQPAPAATAPAQVAIAQPVATPPPAPRPAPIDTQPGKEIAPGVREVTFADGSIYRGGLRGTALHGAGEFVSKEGFKYQGEFLDGKKHGKGNYTWPSGDNFEGEFANDAPSGKGVYKFANGDSYVGEVKNGSVTGRGLYTTKAGDQIDGVFAEGKAGGKGIYKFSSGDRYEGDMVQGKLTGKGVYVSAGGDRIEGEFLDGRPTGGIYRFTNGDRYEGEMKEGALSGRGVYFYSTGLKYEGDMVQGKPNGRGTFWFADGSRFEGQFEDGLKRARGHMIDKDGKKVEAEIVDSAVRLVGG